MKIFSGHIRRIRGTSVITGRDLPEIDGLVPAVAEADKVCFVFDESAMKTVKESAFGLFRRNLKSYIYELPASESAKTLEQAGGLCEFLYRNGFSRRSVLIGAGGGSVTDLTGFTASVYMRGINWISVPTTFLGQIDAGIGGKTAVNLLGGKNIVGTFWQPCVTVCDTVFLDSLPHAELRSGSGELVKYAFVGTKVMYRKIKKLLAQALIGDKAALTSCVSMCAAYKLKVINSDERDDSGLRERLNFGHTAGHALESMCRTRLPHGEAVARGILFSLSLSEKLGFIGEDSAAEFRALIGELHLPPLPETEGGFEDFKNLVAHDKKAKGFRNRFLLLDGIGSVRIATDIDDGLLKAAYAEAVK